MTPNFGDPVNYRAVVLWVGGRRERTWSVLGARARRVMPRGTVVGGPLGNAGLVVIGWVPDQSAMYVGGQ
jgi:hypothetical protein